MKLSKKIERKLIREWNDEFVNYKELKNIFLRLALYSYLLKPVAGAGDNKCLSASCGPHQPEVQFPFRIIGRQPSRCGLPGFDLSCEQNQTTIRLSSSNSSYLVKSISHDPPVISIDPGFCQPNRIAGVNITNTIFWENNLWSYTFYNCSIQKFGFVYPGVLFPCLSSRDYSVIAALNGSFSTGYMPLNCRAIKTIVVPVRSNSNMTNVLELTYSPLLHTVVGVSGDVSGDSGFSKFLKSDYSILIMVAAGVFIGVSGYLLYFYLRYYCLGGDT